MHELGASSLGGCLQLLLPQSLLPVTLGNGQFVRIESDAGNTPMLAAALVTDDDVANEAVVEQSVNRRRAEQNGPCDPLMIQHLEHEKGRAGDRQQREPDPLWE